MFDRVPESIIYCYTVYQPVYDAMQKSSPVPIRFRDGPVTEDELEKLNDKSFHIIILDDMMEKIVKSKDILELFSKYCHHKNITAIMITQNVFMQGTYSRSISLNAHIFVLFANRRDEGQIARLGKQFYSTEWRDFVKAYKDATSEPFSYLIVDITPANPRILQLRTKVFPPDVPVVYSIAPPQ